MTKTSTFLVGAFSAITFLAENIWYKQNMRYLAIITSLFFLMFTRIIAQIPLSPNKLNEQGEKDGQWTILFDKEWNPTKDTSKAEYFRRINYENGKPKDKVTDYYLTGVKQWEGYLCRKMALIKIWFLVYYLNLLVVR